MEKSQDELLREVERRIALLSACEAEWEALDHETRPRAQTGALPLAGELAGLQSFLDNRFAHGALQDAETASRMEKENHHESEYLSGKSGTERIF